MKMIKPMILSVVLAGTAIFFVPELPKVMASGISASGGSGGSSHLGGQAGSSRGGNSGSASMDRGSSSGGHRLQPDSGRLIYDHEREEIKRQEEEERRKRSRGRAPDPPARQASPAPSGN